MLKILDLSYRYRSNWAGKSAEAIQSLSLEIREGEAFGFLGHNGAGKTTTIKCILNLVHATQGTILINGIDNRLAISRTRVGYLPEQPYFYDQLSVREAITMFARLAGLSRNDAALNTRRVIDRLQISDRSEKRLRTLSKGIVQRVAMAQAIVASPRLLILDEPFSGLDPSGRREFRDLILQLRSDGTTIFMSSHVLSDVERICDRASILVGGSLKGIFELKNLPVMSSARYELEVVGTIQETVRVAQEASDKNEERGATVYSFTTRELAEAALKIALNHNIEVVSFGIQKGSLEDLFMALISKHSTLPIDAHNSKLQDGI